MSDIEHGGPTTDASRKAAKVVASVTREQVERARTLLRRGATDREICARLQISLPSLRAIKAHVNRKDGMRGRATAAKTIRSATWGHTMVKWLIARSRSSRRWETASFLGPSGRESAGVVDLVAIRKDFRRSAGRQAGDLFEIILFQIKAGNARRPTAKDVARLRAVQRFYRAKAVVLGEWKKGTAPVFYTLKSGRARYRDPDRAWELVEQPRGLFT